jgi:hypothetical protein
MKGLTLHGWEQDRWLLASLSWGDWERIATDIQTRVTDDTIDAAVAKLPPEYQELDGERLRHDLRGRRDRLLEGARSFYAHLAGEVDIQATDAAEAVTVSRGPDGAALVEIREAEPGDPSAPPVFSRRFDPAETRDLRVYLRGGDDRVTVTGDPGCIRLRMISGDGHKRIDDSKGGGTRIYDADGTVDVVAGPGTSVDERPYELPESDSGFVDVEDVPPRDWGSDLVPVPLFGYEKDVGALIGAGVIYTRYGFRKHPWSSRHFLTAGWATEASQPRVHYEGQFRAENSSLVTTLDMFVSGINTLGFYGFGNETNDDANDKFFRVRSRQLRAAPGLLFTLWDDRLRLAGGSWVEWSKTKQGNRLIDQLEPYGSGSFGMIGAFANVQLDTRRTLPELKKSLTLPFHENPAAGYPTSGFLVDITGEMSPPVWDVKSTWGAIEGSVSAFLTAGGDGSATLALRVGGRDTFGSTPYFKSAFIGGGSFFSGGATVRGLRAERFAGDASVFGNLELRLFLARIKLIVPTDVGVFGFGDVGRVFVDGESSDKWHPGAGGGVWISPLSRTNAISFTVAKSDEETLVYLTLGFHY